MFKSILMCVQSFWTCVYKNTISSQKYSTPFCKLLWDKYWEGYLLEYWHTYDPHPTQFLWTLRVVEIYDDCRGSLLKWQLRWTCTTGNQQDLCLILSQGATCIASGYRGWHRTSSYWTTKLNQKLTKSMPRSNRQLLYRAFKCKKIGE